MFWGMVYARKAKWNPRKRMLSENTKGYSRNVTPRSPSSKMILKDSFQNNRLIKNTPYIHVLCLNPYFRYIYEYIYTWKKYIFFFSSQWLSTITDRTVHTWASAVLARVAGEHPLGPQITHLCEKNVIEQQLRFRLIFSDICIGIHSEDFWCRGQRQRLCVFDVAFVLQRWIKGSQEVGNQLSCRTFSLKRDDFQYSSYWVAKPVRTDTECFYFLSSWAKV